MEETKRNNPAGIVAGVLFTLVSLYSLRAVISAIQHIQYRGGVLSLLINGLMLAGFIVVAVSLFIKKSKIAAAGFAAIAAVYLYYMISSLIEWKTFYVDNLLYAAGYVLAACIAFGLLKKAWFAPGCILFVSFMLDIVSLYRSLDLYSLRYFFDYFDRFISLYDLLEILVGFLAVVAVLLACLWLAKPELAPKKAAPVAAAGSNGSTSYVNEEEGYCSLVKHILLLLFTFGIWQYIWIYKTTAYLNRVKDEEPRNPTTKLLLCMFVPFYVIYWTYKSAQRVDKLSKEKGLQSDLTVLCLILEFIIGIIPPILLQNQINTIATTKKIPETAETGEEPVPVSSSADELKKYKELLDSGVITQEEFDEKKKQLLNL